MTTTVQHRRHDGSLTLRESACRVFQRRTVQHCISSRFHEWSGASASACDTRSQFFSQWRAAIVASVVDASDNACGAARISRGKRIAGRNPSPDILSFLKTARCRPAADTRNLSPEYAATMPGTRTTSYIRRSRLEAYGYDRPSLWRY